MICNLCHILRDRGDELYIILPDNSYLTLVVSWVTRRVALKGRHYTVSSPPVRLSENVGRALVRETTGGRLLVRCVKTAAFSHHKINEMERVRQISRGEIRSRWMLLLRVSRAVLQRRALARRTRKLHPAVLRETIGAVEAQHIKGSHVLRPVIIMVNTSYHNNYTILRDRSSNFEFLSTIALESRKTRTCKLSYCDNYRMIVAS